MSDPNFGVVAIDYDTLLLSPASIIHDLVEKINEAYNKPRYKYNIIKTPRIRNKDTFFDDLRVCHGTMFFFAVEGTYTGIKVVNTPPSSLPKIHATIAYKPIETGYELTAFTSFSRGCGGRLYHVSEQYMVRTQAMRHCEAHVILEHNLEGYYNRLGFSLYKTLAVTPSSVGSVFEKGVMSEPFTLGFMKKDLDGQTV